MALKSAIYKIIGVIIGASIIFLLVDFIFFGSQNIQLIISNIMTAFSQDPFLSWGITLFLLLLIALIGVGTFYRRRGFSQRLRDELNGVERITLVELARYLGVTPARVEVEINRMLSSKVRRLNGLLILSHGKHVYLGEKLLNKIFELYQQEFTRGEIAGNLHIVRADLEKAITHLIERRKIKDREEKSIEKVRPSYRRGTR